MIAAVETSNGVCIVRFVRRVGIRAMALAYCGTDHNAGEGTVQVPDNVFREGQPWPSVRNGLLLKPCLDCKRAAGL